MTQGVEGIFSLMVRGFDRWQFSVNSCPEYNLKSRGVLDEEILPYYPYREDALPLHCAIKTYVSKVVKHYYGKYFLFISYLLFTEKVHAWYSW